MKVKILFSILFVLFLNACGDSSPKLSKLPANAIILAFGDSLTFGYGAKKNESYPSVLQTLSGRKVINAGVSGEESAAGLNRLPELINKHKPKLLILCHGGNDFLRKKNIKKMEANIRQMIQLAKNKDIPVLLLGVPKPGLFLSAYKGYSEIAEETDVIYIEDVMPEILSNKSLKSDAVHPNKDGYRVMAETVYSVLQESGAL